MKTETCLHFPTYSVIQPNLYKTIALGTSQKWSSLTGGCLKKQHLQVFSFYSHCKWFINNKDLKFCLFWCHSWRLKMFLVAFDFKHNYIKKWFYASGAYKLVWCLKLAIKPVFQCNVFIFENNRQTGHDVNAAKWNYLLAPFCMVHLMNQSHI